MPKLVERSLRKLVPQIGPQRMMTILEKIKVYDVIILITDLFREIRNCVFKISFHLYFSPPSAEEPDPIVEDEKVQQDAGEEKPKDQSNARKRVGDDTGHDADMDDTSMSSRASSRMLESINVMSMDSMNVMYDSEYDDLRLASASAGNIVN